MGRVGFQEAGEVNLSGRAGEKARGGKRAKREEYRYKSKEEKSRGNIMSQGRKKRENERKKKRRGRRETNEKGREERQNGS
jgi:hypothetical protein